MPSMNDQFKKARAGPKTAEKDTLVNPSGVYSGMTKRLAITDGSFVDIGGVPKNTRGRIRDKD